MFKVRGANDTILTLVVFAFSSTIGQEQKKIFAVLPEYQVQDLQTGS